MTMRANFKYGSAKNMDNIKNKPLWLELMTIVVRTDDYSQSDCNEQMNKASN